MIEVDPEFSEAPHLRSSIPHPKTDFSKKSNCIAANSPKARVYKTFFSKSRLAFRRLQVKEPRLSETK